MLEKKRVWIRAPNQDAAVAGEVGSVAGRITVASDDDDEVDDAAVAGEVGDAAVAGEVGDASQSDCDSVAGDTIASS